MEIMTVNEVAAWLRVSNWHVYELCKQRTKTADLREHPIPCIRLLLKSGYRDYQQQAETGPLPYRGEFCLLQENGPASSRLGLSTPCHQFAFGCLLLRFCYGIRTRVEYDAAQAKHREAALLRPTIPPATERPFSWGQPFQTKNIYKHQQLTSARGTAKYL